ncbi:(3S)-malyl-CoA thioesterase [Paraburkholderia eburnea]|uniref:(3S)-malyl-CoA thioesterase n=1 Tax=Paraburkholderia eburnea TaxID=1189126 RepID=A0A2S4LZM9_9BURK|nr:thioesterase family protein [Paraburkholderia eburnea]POR47926.1 (3S)-malyl-CoA thioesterase [Paraburkholderia eburnea]PRZ19320.1 (3S)-malyl-CoA thioesterase [Paraburkholderia eburnea]
MSDHATSVVYRDRVRAEWVDYNGHLRDAFYMLIYSHATDLLLDAIGLDAAQREARGRSMYTVEAHVNYLREVREGTPLRVEVRVLEHDVKRVRVYLEMFADEGGEAGSKAATPVCASEQLLLHVDRAGPRAVPFDADVLARVAALGEESAGMTARHAGRSISLAPVRRALGWSATG